MRAAWAWIVVSVAALLAVLIFSQDASGEVSVSSYGTTEPDFPVIPNLTWSVPSVTSTAKSVNQSVLASFAAAVVPTEGKPGDLNYENNNPGNLKYAGQPLSSGPDDKGFAVFPTWDAGMQALQNQLAKNARDFPNFTLLQWAKHYLGMDPNSPVTVTSEGNALTKAESIANSLGVSVNTTLSQLLGV